MAETTVPSSLPAETPALIVGAADIERLVDLPDYRPGARLRLVPRPQYCVLVQYRWERGALVEFSLAAAIREGRKFWPDPESVLVTVKYTDGTEVEIDPRLLSRSTQTAEQAREEIIEAAKSNIKADADGTGAFRSIDRHPDVWARIVAEGPTSEEIAQSQACERQWFTDEEVEAFEAAMVKP